MLIHNFLENSASNHPDKVAVIHDDRRTTYNQLNTQADNLAAHLLQNGVRKGDRIALLFKNCTEYVISYYATLKAGAVAAPLNPGLKPDGLQYFLNHLEPTAIITSFKSERLLKAVDLDTTHLKLLVIRSPKQKWQNAQYKTSTFGESTINPNCRFSPHPDHLASQRPRVRKNTTDYSHSNHSQSAFAAENPKAQINPTNLASIIYTSGSTGEPKGVMLSHKNIVANTNSICQYLKLTENDIQMVVLPFFYVMGKSLLNTHMASGGSIVINNRFMYPADVVKQMIQEKITGFSGVPSTYAYLLNRSPLKSCKDKFGNLRYCSQAGGHMAKSLKHELRDALPKHTEIIIMYGATEAAARLTYLDPSKYNAKIDSIGKPIPDVTMRLLDKEGNDVPDGEEGELVAQGANIMQGYWKDPEDTTKVLNSQGYHTGDIGYRDKDGFLYIKRRKDGLLKVGGHRINPTEIEDFLMATNQTIESSVVGLPDKLMGNKMIALIVPKNDDYDPENLREICAKGLPNHKQPAAIITVRVLPKNANGKIDKNQCQQIALKQNRSK